MHLSLIGRGLLAVPPAPSVLLAMLAFVLFTPVALGLQFVAQNNLLDFGPLRVSPVRPLLLDFVEALRYPTAVHHLISVLKGSIHHCRRTNMVCY